MKNNDQLNYLIVNRNRRNWDALPADFERDAVRAAYNDIKPFIQRNEIKERIQLSKATTFAEMLLIVNGYNSEGPYEQEGK